jgi:hypothetical protein
MGLSVSLVCSQRVLYQRSIQSSAGPGALVVGTVMSEWGVLDSSVQVHSATRPAPLNQGFGRAGPATDLVAPASQLDAEVVASDVDGCAVVDDTLSSLDLGSGYVVADGDGKLLFHAGLTHEDGEHGVEGAIGQVVALGPALPGDQCSDVEALFANGGRHRIEEVDGVAGPELVVGGALVGDCVGVAFDGGAGSLAGALQVILGPVELPFGGV